MDLHPEINLLSQKLLPELEISVKIFDKASFVNKVSPYISSLLVKDFQKLVQIMYRIDVSEKEFALTLIPEGNKNIAVALSEMIFDRLLLKAKYRAKYKKEKNA
jgi:hypothetical protein